MIMVLAHLLVGVLVGGIVGLAQLMTAQQTSTALESYALAGSLALLASALLSRATPRPFWRWLNRHGRAKSPEAKPPPAVECQIYVLPKRSAC